MPELPEMENYKTLLSEKILNQSITNVIIEREKSINVQAEIFKSTLIGQKISTVARRAKHLLFHLGNNKVLLLHLMLGGSMFYGTKEEKPDRTAQVTISFGDKNLYFIGLRLGYLHLLSREEVEKELNNLGPEPVDSSFEVSLFIKEAFTKRGIMKTTLTDQDFIAGIGNRYSDEICYHARILPKKKMNELKEEQMKQLFLSIQHILNDASKKGGYMSEPLFIDDQKTGGYLPYFKVYNREGEQCERCGDIIIKEKISSRKTFYCPGCQS